MNRTYISQTKTQKIVPGYLAMNDLEFKCDICENQYKNKYSLQRHTNLIHASDEKVYKCNLCEFQSIHIYSLSRHRKTQCTKKNAHVMNDNKFICQVSNCSKRFNTKNSLRGHTRYSHKLVEFKCPECEKTFTTNQTLQQHMKAAHENKKYPCNQCDYQASYVGNLRKHINTMHIGVKYPCSVCSYRATEKQQLKIHFETKHEGKKHKYQYCDDKGTQKENLKRLISIQYMIVNFVIIKRQLKMVSSNM